MLKCCKNWKGGAEVMTRYGNKTCLRMCCNVETHP